MYAIIIVGKWYFTQKEELISHNNILIVGPNSGSNVGFCVFFDNY